LIVKLITEINGKKGQKELDSELYYTEAFSTTNYKNWIKKVEKYFGSRTGKSGVPLSHVICSVDVNLAEATDVYTQAKSAASFDTKQYCNNKLGLKR
jgi:hypothetical protein